MLVFAFGIVLFALGICVSIALHEAGHMVAAKSFGMKVRRYFVGFGPRMFSFRRGETEYGVKWIPLGGFCDIAGMTALDEVTADEAPRAMWRYKVWKRTVVMVAGSFTHFVIGFIVLYLLATTMGLPNVFRTPTVGEISQCVQSSDTRAEFANPNCQPDSPAPARESGLQTGDVVVAMEGEATETFTEVIDRIQHSSGPTRMTVRRDGETLQLSVDVARVRHPVPAGDGPDAENKMVTTGAIGASFASQLTYGPGEAVGATVAYTGDVFHQVWKGLLHIPEKVPEVVAAAFGKDVDQRPVSVVGASRIGGQLAEAGLWSMFLLLLANLNFFVGLFNMVPLLPLDGGHVAVTWYERVRDWLRRLRGKQPGGPADYTKLNTVTAVVVVIVGGFMALTVFADIISPVQVLQ